MKTLILDHGQVLKILKRMAYQIYEKNFDKKELIFAAITGQGVELAQLVKTYVQEISSIRVHLTEVKLSKEKPAFNSAELAALSVKLSGQTIVMFDDVLNTGRTLVFGMHPFLQADVSRIQIAVLVDRNHKSFPVAADYIGMSLQTTTQEHVAVTMRSGKFSVHLS